ncbi:FAD binding domain-containing protein [Niveispirillum cyanobacteriorum]|uniref:Carbon monoxide dehydrogenase n=1 Tax=Niveispirillum cyanobacteriorum TaxID=1612173 RepID=A0A2K9NJW9_9PROT|nr:FAD binding domain-containing protein [Niveispirillum cyanobacteriorum]AUN33378.1 carbon monoxide dehydrogenase [Niveispirillum cyanobacteriorum]GGE49229.1 carbon monoxide dehydrogenase [Niveispirillum cyanobacteriorum]
MYGFDYHRPATLSDVVELLTGDEDAKALAGGQTLIPTLKQRLAMPTSLVDLSAVPGLREIAAEGDGVRIGAMATHAAVAGSDVVRAVLPGLADLAAHIGDPQVRNRGTIGGSIANADPAADYPAAVVALDAVIRTDRRDIAGGQFFTGLFETALLPGEVVTSVFFPAASHARYAKFPNPASRYAIAGVFVAQRGDAVRVAVTGAAASVFRWDAAEAALTGRFSADALDGLVLDADGLNSDMHADAAYRAHLVAVLARRSIA